MLEGEGITADITVPSERELQGLDRLELDLPLGCSGHVDAGAAFPRCRHDQLMRLPARGRKPWLEPLNSIARPLLPEVIALEP